MRLFALAAAVLAVCSCRGMSEPDDVVMPTYNPSIQQSLLQTVDMAPPRGEGIEYMAWSVEDHKALTTWTANLGEAESMVSDSRSKHPLLNFTVLWRQNPAPTGGKLNFSRGNE